MPRKKKKTSKAAPVDLVCLNCSTTFNGELRGETIVCQQLRQHIRKTAVCLQLYIDDGLVNRGNVIDLQTSVVSRDKRKAPEEPMNIPPPKRILLCELHTTVLQERYGALPSTNMLAKGQLFADKTKIVRTRGLHVPDTHELNKLLCHGGIFVNHISKHAIIFQPKMEDLVNGEKEAALPTEILIGGDDNSSFISSVVIENVWRQQGSLAPIEESNVEEDVADDESDSDIDGGSLRGGSVGDDDDDDDDEGYGDFGDNESDVSTQRIGNVAQNPNTPTITTQVHGARNDSGERQQNAVVQAAPPTTTEPVFPPRLLERLNKQEELNTIKPSIGPDPLVISELGLLRIQHKHGLSLSAVKEIKRWAHESYMDYPKIFLTRPLTRKKQLKKIRKAMGITYHDSFKEIAVNWLPQNKPRGIQVRDILDGFYELLSNKDLNGDGGCNLSFPDPTNPYAIYPREPPEHASEIHHGWWYAESAKRICTEPNDILGVVIGYMDGVQTDKNGRLPVTPFNVTLGLFNTETRRRADAWTTILLYPDDDSEASIQKGTKPIHKIQNLHNCLRVAFRDLKRLMDGKMSIPWRLQYAGKSWDVNIKFAFGFVIGDTEMHDKLCGRYLPRTQTIKSICRHCNVATESLAEGGDKFEESLMYTPEMLDPDVHTAAYFKSISHHPIRNAFHELDFGANRFNIHLATPGKLLHMVQKGACTRVLEGFVHMWTDPSVEQDSITAVENNHRSKILLDELDLLGKMYGGFLSRQSDRDRPRTKFRSSLFNKSKVGTHQLFLLSHL